ncbi:ATP-dependent DNA helicase pif1-like [Gigaspora margarita]|uniref:ATP-dependent DNA helicase n=1 Tax=Gigaspora margarita TaxID=4874 RepID=A0A8H4EUP0_GIGMA|nr:ATP-dependent DNA helicase pif1-like [Gigaspora margarita]
MIASLISSISQSKIANLYNIQLSNLQKFSTYIPTTALLNLPYDQYMVLSKLTSTLGPQNKHKWPYFFITSSAGTEKSYIITLFINILCTKNIKYLLLAPTEVATNNIGERTIRSALNITSSNILQTSIFQSPEKIKELKQIKTIIIDKISMVSDSLFTFISNTFARIYKNTLVFGGINIVVSDNLAQLPLIHGMQVFQLPV